MIKHHFSLICGHAVIDERTKFLSIFNVIEQIKVNAEPDQTVRIPMRFDLVSVWVKSDINNSEAGISRVSLCNPNGTSNKICEVEIELTDSSFFRSIISFSGIELKGSGLYNFLIEFKQNDHDWEKVSELFFTVSYETPEKSSQ
jgi:hypothetical protein